MNVPTDPQREYSARRERRQAEAKRLAAQTAWLPTVRLLTFVAFLGLAAWALQSGTTPIPAGAALAAFVAAVVLHKRGAARLRRARQAVAFYDQALERLADRWQGQGSTGERFGDPRHPYADHLDLFGRGSLFQLLCTARTPMGEETLANWLRTPAEPAEVRARQEALCELRDLIDLREELASVGPERGAQFDPPQLAAWSTSPSRRFGLALRVPAAGLGLAFMATLAAWFVGAAPLAFCGLVLAGEAMVLFALRRRIGQVAGRVEGMSRQLSLFLEVLRRVERRQFTAARLRTISARLRRGGLLPSREIRRLQRWLHLHESLRLNQLSAPLALGLMTPMHTAGRLERWRIRVGACVGDWLSAIGEFEALLSLANYAYEHPADPFPSLAEDGAVFSGGDLGHPLLPQAVCRRNDLRLDGRARAILISGSNMSGKSTMLRTVGVNVVLALAGAPVRAAEMTLSPLALGACINVRDSLQEGQSHFYAEMARLRDITRMLDNGRPVLFLLDEIMHGTNSHDRRIGTEAVLRILLDRGAIGLVTTHDLALAEMEQALQGRMANAHFEDQVVDGRMVFDYKMRPGVVRKSNALEIMRSLGLDV